ncbi:MAG: fused MFS/spermidine synthase [Pseudomonadota bacterium]|jgi:spermidine synthase|nr:MAG: spermidine synthase [Pseudomonadota bacterium]
MKNFARLLPLVLLTMGSAGPALAQKLIHSERSMYRDVLVYEERGERCMCFTRECRIGRQSCIYLARPREFALNYTHMVMGGLLFATSAPPKTLLIVGLGGGTLPTALREVLPDAVIDTVEIDPAVTGVARRFFGFKEDPKMKVYEMDGRVYVKRAIREGKKYDAILLDAFDHEYIPEHLLTKEFLTEVKSLLAPGGVLVGNTFSSSRLYDHESTTYAAVFGTFYNLKAANRVIVAKPAGLPTMEQLRARAMEYELALRGFGVDVNTVLGMFNTRQDWNPNARVLTDQYSPANLLNH